MAAAIPVPRAAPATEPATPVRAAVRSTARKVWRREAPTQRSRPMTRVWRATRVVKVVVMTMIATTAHTGASRLIRVLVVEPPAVSLTAFWAIVSSAVLTVAVEPVVRITSST